MSAVHSGYHREYVREALRLRTVLHVCGRSATRGIYEGYFVLCGIIESVFARAVLVLCVGAVCGVGVA